MKTNEITLAREFDENDWNGLAGALPFRDGSSPLVRDIGDDIRAIADRDGLHLIVVTDHETFDCEFLHLVLDGVNSRLSRIILDGLPADLNIDSARDFGFRLV